MSYSDSPPPYDETPSRPSTHLPQGSSADYEPPRHRPRTPPTLSHSLQDVYNPNPELPFRYPIKFFCKKCKNQGFRADKGNKPCKECWGRFHRTPPPPKPAPQPRPPISQAYRPPPPANYHGPPQPPVYYGQPQTPMMYYPPPMMAPPMSAPRVVRAGHPSLGGQLCWRCNGSGRIRGLMFFDDENCYKCRGTGRVY